MLSQALESLRQQTYQDFVVIICDDDSTENLQEVVNQFSDLKIKYHRQITNIGQFKNSMQGIEMCKTPFMKFLHSDDLLFPTALEKQIEALKKMPNAAICLGGIIEFEEFPQQQKIELYNSTFPYIPESRVKKQWAKLEEYTGFLPSACLYRRELFHKIGGFNTELIGIADWELYLALSAKYPVVAVNEYVCALRTHADQVTKKYFLNSDVLYIKDMLWMTSDANSKRERICLPRTQQIFIRHQICWKVLRYSLTFDGFNLGLVKKWLELIIASQMLFPLIFGFPFFLAIHILRKPKQQINSSHNSNLENYQQIIRSILFNSSVSSSFYL
jgi:glycosyltransferase involved in cell wall biosynthesis